MARNEPRVSRPRLAKSYGISQDAEGLLPWSWAAERLVASRSYWIGTTRADGSPHAAPVWGLWLDDAFVFGTAPDSRKGKNVRRDPRAVVHLESGDEVVILEGVMEPAELDERIADAYEAKYDFRPERGESGDDGWYRLRPRVAYGWLERDYPASATRFGFA